MVGCAPPSVAEELGFMKTGGGVAGHPHGFVYVPAGSIDEGCNPGRHGRCLGQHLPPFYVQSTVVSRDDYQRCLDAGVCVTPPTFHDPRGNPCRVTNGWIYNSRLVVTMHGRRSYRYGQDPDASGQIAFRCVDGDPPPGGGTEEGAWAQDILR
jgi:hypothetical protein